MESLKKAWLDEVCGSENTRISYENIKIFLNYANTTLEDIVKEWDSIETYRQEKAFAKKWKRILKAYKNHLRVNGSEKEKNLTPKTIENYIAPINSFFKWYEIPVRIKHERRVRVTYHNKDISNEQIDSILSNTPHIRDKAYYSMLKDSGLRPITVKQLQYIDMKEDWESGNIPCRIHVPEHKNKGNYTEHYTFIGIETVEYLRKYWSLRYGKGNNPGDSDLVFLKLNEDSPISTNSLNMAFSRIALKLGITEKRDKAGKRKEVTQYNLRKFFRNQITNAPEVDSVDARFFMGHSIDKADSHYFSTENVEKFREKYAKGYEHLKTKEIPKSVITEVFEKELSDRDLEIKRLKEENLKLREQLGDLTDLGEAVSVAEAIKSLRKDVTTIKKGLGKGKRLFDEDY